MTVREFRDMIEAGEFDRDRLHADIGEVVAGRKPGRERDDERILVHHRDGVARHRHRLAHLPEGAGAGLGTALPTAIAQQALGPKD